MEKSIKINISGVIFQIHENAYELLRDYLQSVSSLLSNVQGGGEMIDDIEARIAEIFQSKPSWQTAVISKDEVEEMISIMGKPEDIAGDLESEIPGGSYSRQQKKLYRNKDNAIIGGVCSGISDYTGIDAVWIRIIFILFALVYLSGAVVYAILWIVLPVISRGTYLSKPAKTARKTEKARRDDVSAVGNAFNEIFRAFGKFFIILFRVILAIIGVAFIIGGFTALLSLVMVLFSHTTILLPDIYENSVIYLPEFMFFIADPALSVWLVILISLVILLPLLALIYWGVRMVFQIRVRDLALNLIMLIVWILGCTTLIIIAFTHEISFSDSYRTSMQMSIPVSDSLTVRLDDRISSLEYDREVHLPFEPVNMYLDKEEDIIYVSPEINIYHTDDDPYIEILKYSSGTSRSNAIRKAEKLNYDISIDDDLVKLDEYFSLSPGQKWLGAFIKIRFYIPDNMIIYFDEEIEELMHDDYFGCGVYSWRAGGKYWKMIEGRLEETD